MKERGYYYPYYVLFIIQCIYISNQYFRFLYTSAKIPFIDYTGNEFGPLFSLFYTASGIGIGYLADNIESRMKYLAFFCVGWSGLTALVSFTTSFYQVALLRIGQGIFEAGCSPFAISILADYFNLDTDRRGLAFGVYNASIYIGYSLAITHGGDMAVNFGWRDAYRIPALLVISVLVPLALLTVNEPNRNKTHTEFVPLRRVGKIWLKSRTLLLLCLAVGIRSAGGYIWGNYTSLFFSPLYETERDVAGTIVSCNGTRSCTSDSNYCIKSECKRISDTPWHNIGMTRKDFDTYMSWIPLVGGSFSSVLGGYVADVAFSTSLKERGPVLVVLTSTILSVPFAYGAIVTTYPWCFLNLFIAYVIGETYLTVCMSIVVREIPNASMIGISIAIYSFILSNIYGNSPMLLPWISSLFKDDSFHEFLINSSTTVVVSAKTKSDALQSALVILYPGLYLLSSVCFALLYYSYGAGGSSIEERRPLV